MMVAPRSFAFITQRKPTGCASAIEEPSIKMQSAFARSCCAVVAPPRPKEVPRPGTVLAKIPLADGRLRIALDGNQFSVLVINQLPAPDSAVGTNRARDLRIINPGMHRTRLVRHRLKTGAVLLFADLPY